MKSIARLNDRYQDLKKLRFCNISGVADALMNLAPL